LNDIWQFNGTAWKKIQPLNAEDAPQERGGHQMVVYKNRFLLIFGGMQEVTNELNDLNLFDLQ
jgi:hypothetical protein